MKDILYTIDQGNSHPHVGLHIDGQLQRVFELENFSPDQKSFDLVASEVGHLFAWEKQFGKTPVTFRHLFKKHFFLDMPVNYTNTLGQDRLYQSYYLFKKMIHENKFIALVDCGTFITIDLINKKGHQGGWIYPGINTFLDSYTKGARLPRLDSQNLSEQNIDPGHSTEEAILNATTLYLRSIAGNIHEQYHLFITGGQGEQFTKLNLDHKKSYQLEPHLIHRSLNFIFREVYQ